MTNIAFKRIAVTALAALNLTMATGWGGWRRADLVSGNGTDALVFEYTVIQRTQGNGKFDDGVGGL